MIVTKVYKSPIGDLIIGSVGDRLCLCDWAASPHHRSVTDRLKRHCKTDIVSGDSSILRLTARQLNEFFSGIRTMFNIPVAIFGTEFQEDVWLKIAEIPFGETTSYSQLAKAVNRPASVRTVANACGANAMSIIIPCHRVVAIDGSLGGYAGGVDTKQWLQAHEKSKNELIIGDIKPLSILVSNRHKIGGFAKSE